MTSSLCGISTYDLSAALTKAVETANTFFFFVPLTLFQMNGKVLFCFCQKRNTSPLSITSRFSLERKIL